MTSLSASPMATPDHNKRKHEELELNNTPEQPTESDLNAKSELGTLEVENGGDDESEAKRPRLEMETSNGNEPDGDENGNFTLKCYKYFDPCLYVICRK